MGRDAATEADEDKAADAWRLATTEFEEEAVNDEAVTDLHQGTACFNSSKQSVV